MLSIIGRFPSETERIQRHIGNEGPDGEAIIPPADATCSMCKSFPSQQNKEETPLHLMTECVGLYDLRREIFGTHNPQPPFNFSVHQIVSFLKEAKIPTFPMQPFLEELYPAAPSGVPDPTPDPIPDPISQTPHTPTQQAPLSPSTEVTGRHPQNFRTIPPTAQQYPEGEKWYHSYLYISNPQPKPHQEKKIRKQIHMRPLRY